MGISGILVPIGTFVACSNMIAVTKVAPHHLRSRVSRCTEGRGHADGANARPCSFGHFREVRRTFFSSSYSDGADGAFLDSSKAEWLWEFAEATDIVVHIHPPRMLVGHEALMEYGLNDAVGRLFDSIVKGARMIAPACSIGTRSCSHKFFHSETRASEIGKGKRPGSTGTSLVLDRVLKTARTSVAHDKRTRPVQDAIKIKRL